MTDTRKNIVLNENEPSLLDMSLKNQDIIKFSLPASQSASDAIQVMSKLSQTCHTFHSLFKQQLHQQAAKILCQHVVYGEKSEAEKLLAKNPRLLLVKIQVTDEAGRQIVGTAFQIALGAKDVSPFPDYFEEMAEMIAGYFKKIPDGEAEKQKQYAEQFPEGFEKLEEARREKDSVALNTVFAKVRKSTTMTEAEEAVTAFQIYLSRQIEGVIKSGYHFNENLFHEGLELYDKNYEAFGGYDSKLNQLVAIKVLGGIQRYFPANHVQAACTGYYMIVDHFRKSSRSKILADNVTSFFSSELGVSYFVINCQQSPACSNTGVTTHCIDVMQHSFNKIWKMKMGVLKNIGIHMSRQRAPVCD